MPFAVVPFIDIGPSPYRPATMRRQALGADQGGTIIRLGRNRALIWTPFEILDSRALTLADDRLDRVSSDRRALITEKLCPDGRTFDAAMRWQDIAKSLLFTPPVGADWKPVRSRKDGQKNIWLGPPTQRLLYTEQVAPRLKASKDISDTFNRSGNLAGSTTSDGQTTWAEDQGTGWATDGAEAELTAVVNFCVARLVAGMDTDDHSAEIDITTFTRVGVTNLFLGVTVRTNATPTEGYSFEVGTNAAGTNLRRLYDFVDDSIIVSDATSPALGALYLEFNGSDYACKIGGTSIFTGTDTQYAGELGVGMAGYNDFATNVGGTTSFRGKDLVAGGAAVRKDLLLLGVGQ